LFLYFTFKRKIEAMESEVVIVEGCRTPFLRSGTGYQDLMAYQLGATAIKGIFQRTGLSPDVIEKVFMGTVVHNVVTSNVARESALTAGIPSKAPATTVSQACVSANAAIASAADQIRLGHADVIIAGGVDCVSDIPITFKKKMRKKLFGARNIKSTGQALKFLLSLRPADFKPDIPDIAEFTTGVVMGKDCDISAAKYGISREAQDEYAVRSHHMAAKASEEGWLSREIQPVEIPPKFKPIEKDNGIRASSSFEKLQKLRPAFDKRNGTLTAGNSSFLTDGASAVLLMSRKRADELGLPIKAVIRDYLFTGRDPKEELLLGPAYSISYLLHRNRLGIEDIDVIEIHEAFAAQVLYNLKLMDSDEFAKDQLKGLPKVGKIPMEKLNLWGGSLALGHPFGATGGRITTTAANRLHHEKGKFAILAACAAGGHGHAMLLENTN
jgi:acetyl-CoA acyltransferase